MGRTGQSVSLETFDRLEEKVTLLVTLLGRLRTEQARMAEEQVRLTRELELARARLQEAEGSAVEVGSLKEERELIRTRVSSMLDQLGKLGL